MLQRATRVDTARLDAIIQTAAERYGVTPAEVKGKSRNRDVVWARHVAVALCHRITGARYADLARHFGKKDAHGSIAHALRQVADACECYPQVAQEIAALEAGLKGQP